MTSVVSNEYGWVFVGNSIFEFEATVLVVGLLIYLLVLILLSTLVAFLTTRIRKSLESSGGLRTKLGLLLVIPVGSFLALLLSYSALSFVFGGGCIPIYGGGCAPLVLAPYILFYSTSALGLFVYLRVALRLASYRSGRVSVSRRVRWHDTT